MSTKDRGKSGGKPRQRSQRSQKAERQQKAKPDQRDEDQISPMVASTDAATNSVAPPSELPASDVSTPLIEEVASTDAPSIGAVAPADEIIQTIANANETVTPLHETASISEVLTDDVTTASELPSTEASAPLLSEGASTDARPSGAVAPAESRPVSMRTIANAYGSYTEKSFQETTSFVEKLVGVRSFGKVVEVQAEFAGQAYATFVAESQKICGLYAELAKQTFSSWQGFATRVNQSGR